jgi:GGDEF domain-containing protein/tetratricopeptide (TPR) repeat protein
MPDISKRLEKAEKYLQKGKSEAALEEYLDALQEDPKNDQVRQAAADLCVACGRKSEAATLLTELLNGQVSTSDPRGVVTYKKLLKVASPTPFQMLQYAHLISKKDKKEALDAYSSAMKGFERTMQDEQAFSVAKEMAELDPTVDNLQRLGEKAARLGEGQIAAESFVRLGILKEAASPGTGFEWFDRAHYYDAFNLPAIVLYAKGLFSQKALPQCIAVLEHAVTHLETPPELRELYVKALIAAQRPKDAEPFGWELFEKGTLRNDDIAGIIGCFLDTGDADGALNLCRKLERHETKAGRRREFISGIQEMTNDRLPSVDFLEYLVELFNSANREQEYCRTLVKVFQLRYAEGNYPKAGEALERAAEVDPYEPGHGTRLEMLRGKIDAAHFNRVANRFQSVSNANTPEAPAHTGGDARESEPTAVEDFILQAEIYLQYGMRSKALELLEKVQRLFPGEDLNNEKLRHLYQSAGLPVAVDEPAPSPGGKPAGAAPAHAAESEAKSQMSAGSTGARGDSAMDHFARVTEITRNIYRQANVKSVLFTAVNEIGRYFNAGRCVAGLCSLGKPPSAALEYCAPGIKQSDVMAIVKLIAVTRQLATKGAVNLPDAKHAQELEPVREHIQALQIESLLAVPLMDAGEQVGLLILEECKPRQWDQNEIEVLKTIAEQMVLAVSNARLRTLMKSLAVTDEKSGLLKRSSYLDVLLSEVRRSLQQQTPLTVMLLQFGRAAALIKEVGEPAVETMMQQIGQTIGSHVRQNDVCIRYDVTSIALLLSDTGEKNAFLAVEKMKKVLALNKIPGTDRTPPIIVGIAEVVLQSEFDPIDIVTEVINRVEAALEIARSEGGNKARALAANLEPVA